MQKIIVFHTDHFINKTVTQFLAKSNGLIFDSVKNFNKYEDFLFASYGFRRENEEIFLKLKNYIYIDHGYMSSSGRKFLDNKKTTLDNFGGYFRIIRNDFFFNKNFFNEKKIRFNNLNITLKDLNKDTEYIIISEPSDKTLKFLNIPNWTNQTIEILKRYTDRKIIVHNKFSEVPLSEVLKKAFAFVSCQSTAAFSAIANGVPSYFTHDSLRSFGQLKDIENRKLNHEFLYTAANSQWKLSEFFSDEFKIFFNKINNQ